VNRSTPLRRGAWTREKRDPVDLGPNALNKPVRLVKPASRLESKSELKRGGPIRRSNPVKKARKFARNFGEHRAFIVGLPCSIRLKRSGKANPWKIDPAHAIAAGMGGAKGTWRDLIPLSWDLHKRQHTMTIDQFERLYDVPLLALRHVLVVADPGVDVQEQLEAWRRLHEHPEHEILAALQRGYDMCGYVVVPPSIPADSSEAASVAVSCEVLNHA
jgi:hypothetical protein